MTTMTPPQGTYRIDEERSLVTFRTRHLFGLGAVRGTQHPVELAIDEVKADDTQLTVRATTNIDRYALGVTAMKGLAARRLSARLEIVATRRDEAGR